VIGVAEGWAINCRSRSYFDIGGSDRRRQWQYAVCLQAANLDIAAAADFKTAIAMGLCS
jgi:hypothetical protein